MASVRRQNFDAIAAKLEAVRIALGWQTVVRNPRKPIGEDQMNAIVLDEGGEPDPDDLTGGVEINLADFAVGMVVMETGADSAEDLLDLGFVAICDALQDPNDIQLGGLAIGVLRGGLSKPFVGTSAGGARIVGVQTINFTVQYMAREGDASTPGP
jgi:hypothetical protein